MPGTSDPGRTAWADRLSDFDRRITAIEGALRSGTGDIEHFVGDATTGLGTVFQNGWLAYDAVRLPRFYKVWNQVYIYGIVKSGSLGSAAFTLPKGYWPSVEIQSTTNANGTFAGVAVESDGRVIPNVGSVASYFWLDGANFRAA